MCSNFIGPQNCNVHTDDSEANSTSRSEGKKEVSYGFLSLHGLLTTENTVVDNRGADETLYPVEDCLCGICE